MNSSPPTDRLPAGKRRMRKVLDFEPVAPFAIDEEDYLVVCEMLSMNGVIDDRMLTRVREMVEIRDDDNDRRVYKIRTTTDISSLPPSIGRLQNLKDLDLKYTKCLNLPEEIGDLASLTKLDLSESKITSLPPSIGRLQNLKDLDLSMMLHLSNLPEEIGDLTSLTKLDLSISKITSLPPSIGRLQNLKDLDLKYTECLNLPEEIGDLASLTKLDLSESKITSLPPSIGRLQSLTKLNLSLTSITSLPHSIGRLQNLKDLDLSMMLHLSNLPEEIGDLTSLTKLDLSISKITSLPPSIGRLQNLEYLDLGGTDCLSNLPEEIGNITNLKELNLSGSDIKWLPDSIERLKGLLYLDMAGTKVIEPQGEDQNEFLMRLVQRHQFLSFLGIKTHEGQENLNYFLACNRARFHAGFGITDDSNSTPKLLPLMLKHATRAFNKYPTRTTENAFEGYGRDPRFYYKNPIEEPDAMYWFLLNGRESFINALLDRNTKDEPRGMKGPGTDDPDESAATKNRSKSIA